MTKIADRLFWIRFDLRQWWQVRLPQRVAHALPRRLVYFAVIRAWAEVARNQDACTVTADQAAKRFES